MARGGGSAEKLRLQQVPMNLKLALTALVTLCLAEMAGCFDRCGHVKAYANLVFQRWDKNLRTYGLGHLLSAMDICVPKAEEHGRTPVRRVHGRHSAGSSRVGTKPNTLMDMRTDLTAVPHAGLGFHFLRVPGPSEPGGLEEEVRPKAQGRRRRTGRNDDDRSCLQQVRF